MKNKPHPSSKAARKKRRSTQAIALKKNTGLTFKDMIKYGLVAVFLKTADEFLAKHSTRGPAAAPPRRVINVTPR